MTFLRHRQRVVTAITPHNANRRFIIPNRGKTGGGPGPGPGPDYLHQSTFTAPDSTLLTAYTPEIGNPWESALGSQQITNNRLEGPASGTNTVSTPISQTDNYAVKWRGMPSRAGSSDRVLHQCHVASDAAGYGGGSRALFMDANPNWRLAEWPGNTIRASGGAYADGVEYAGELRTEGAKTTYYQDDVEIFSYDAFAVAGAYVGIRQQLLGTPVGVSWIDDFTVEALPAPPPPAFLHQSTFTAANGTALTAYTPEIGNPWTILVPGSGAGFRVIQDNKWDGNGTNWGADQVECGQANVVVKADVTTPATNVAGGILGRVVDNGNHWWIALQSPDNNRITENVGNDIGQGTIRASFAQNVNGLVDEPIEVRFDGDDITMIRGGLSATYNASTFNTVTKFGLAAKPSDKWDNFTVEAI